MPNKLSQFWQELKRRKVLRVITVYAGAAFVILELVDIVSPSLRLPEWTMNFMIVLLCAGFIIAVILSWIYDIHPEGGIVKTEPAYKVTQEDIPNSSNSWKIASYISFVVIVGLIILNIIPRTGNKEILDKSIAVLPFESLSEDPEKQYQADGVMDAILLHLSKIEELRVISRTSVEQYREKDKTINEICEELDVAYILEGSFRRYGDKARLIVQLIQSGQEGHAWANQYDRDWKDIFTVESEVAQAVAGELQAIITPEEKVRIEKTPTTSLTAYDLYQKGREEHLKYWVNNDDQKALERAEDLYYNALEYDSTFALAYTGLAYVYLNKHYWESYFSEDFLDSVLILAGKALSFDPQLSDAYTVRGDYFREHDQFEQSILEYDKAIKLNPNDWMAFIGRGRSYSENFNQLKAIENFHKAISLYRGPLLSNLFRILGWTFWQAGFPEKLRYYAHQALMLDGDSISYYYAIASAENYLGNSFAKSLEKIYQMDTTRTDLLGVLGQQYGYEGEYEKSLEYLKKYYKRLEASGAYRVPAMHRLGYAYWMNGFHAEADYYFEKMMEYYNDLKNIGRAGYNKYNLAGIYALRGEKQKAYENLQFFDQQEKIPYWFITLFRIDPFFDSLRDEPEFQQILREVEAKYQAEHERVRQWMEENEML